MKYLIFLILILLAPFVFASDITLSLNQTDYYFLVGGNAAIVLETHNTYDKPVPGTFTYTITQNVNQGGMQYSSTNSQSKSFTLPAKNETITVGFGSSNQPATLNIALVFKYVDGVEKEAHLDGINIHFVQDESQKQNQQNKKESKTKEQQQQEQKKASEEAQKKMDEMFNKQKQNEAAQNRVQDNQMATDSQSIKEQLKQDLEKKQKAQEEFKKSLAENEDFKKAHEELTKEGYTPTEGMVDAENNNTGNFEMNYEKNGEKASLKGSMQNGTMDSIEKSSTEGLKKALDLLQNDSKFKKYDEMLNNENFKALEPKITEIENKTLVELEYQNDKNETAIITATIEDDEVKKVKLDKAKDWGWIYSVVGLILLLTLLLVYRNYYLKKKVPDELPKLEKPINVKKESLNILKLAKKLFQEKKYKDAYGKAAESIRFYYSHSLKLKTELTNTDLLKLLKKKLYNYERTRDCLNLCGLVEFAKYTANKKDFKAIIELAEDIIN